MDSRIDKSRIRYLSVYSGKFHEAFTAFDNPILIVSDCFTVPGVYRKDMDHITIVKGKPAAEKRCQRCMPVNKRIYYCLKCKGFHFKSSGLGVEHRFFERK